MSAVRSAALTNGSGDPAPGVGLVLEPRVGGVDVDVGGSIGGVRNRSAITVWFVSSFNPSDASRTRIDTCAPSTGFCPLWYSLKNATTLSVMAKSLSAVGTKGSKESKRFLGADTR